MASWAKVGADNLAVFYPPSGDYPNYSGTAQWIGMIQDLTFDQNENRTPTRYVGGGDRNLDVFIDGTTDYSGRIRYYPQDGKLWTFAIGSTSTANGSVVTISETGGRIYWGGLELFSGKANATTGLLRGLYGVTIDRLRISSREGEAVECEIEFACGSVTVSRGATKPTVTEYTRTPYMWDDVEIKISGIPWNDTFRGVKEFAWEVNNNLEHPFYLNYTRFKGESIPAARDYSLDLTMNLIETSGDSLYADYYWSGTVFNMDVIAWRVSGTANTENFNISMSGCKMTAMEITYPIEGVCEQTCTIVPESCAIIVKESGTASYPNWSVAK